ncbi:hypothetical protein GURKE_00510 [Brevundimonas phage vB_BpoS-Gurke]|uniref:Uncharacterized protein n=1 Tax=Brevundimonas phage vB_BpoS-Gurke TaxID=2948599 RepID=A0A9E7SQG3_9CAUD|nr:hypothetical protein GURKE_00510 [Brevundimonas phage vB_BpoS-Gurke]
MTLHAKITDLILSGMYDHPHKTAPEGAQATAALLAEDILRLIADEPDTTPDTAKACGDRLTATAEALEPWMKHYPPSTRRTKLVEAANAANEASCGPLLDEILGLKAVLAFVKQDRDQAWRVRLEEQAQALRWGESFGQASRQLTRIAREAMTVMSYLEKHGPSIVPHLMDSDDNPGQRLRDALDDFATDKKAA